MFQIFLKYDRGAADAGRVQEIAPDGSIVCFGL